MITYFTDNTVNYFANQYFYCILLPSFAMENKFFMKKSLTERWIKDGGKISESTVCSKYAISDDCGTSININRISK